MFEKDTTADVPVVSIHSGTKASEARMLSRVRLYEAVQAVDGYPVMTHGKGTFDESSGQFINHYRVEQAPSQLYLRQLGAVTVHSARDYSRRFETDRFPFLNHPELRRLCRDKWSISQLRPELFPVSFAIDSRKASQLEAAVWAAPGHQVVVKPVESSMGRHIYIGEKQAVIDELRAGLVSGQLMNHEWLVQELINTKGQLPSVRPASEHQQRKLERATGPKELRIYLVDTMPVLAVVRAAADPNALKMGAADQWIFIDQDGVPEVAWEQSKALARAIRAQADQLDSLMAVDQVWDGERWRFMEVNHEATIQHQGDPEAEQWLIRRDRSVGVKLVAMAKRLQASGTNG